MCLMGRLVAWHDQGSHALPVTTCRSHSYCLLAESGAKIVMPAEGEIFGKLLGA